MDRSSPHPTNNASLLVRFETRAYMRFGSQKVSSVACSRDAKLKRNEPPGEPSIRETFVCKRKSFKQAKKVRRQTICEIRT